MNLYLDLPPTLKQLYFEYLPERLFELILQFRRNEVRSVTFLSCWLWLARLIKWIVCLGKTFLKRQLNTVADRPPCRSTTRISSVSVSRRIPRLTFAVFRHLNSFVEFTRLTACAINWTVCLSRRHTLSRPNVRFVLHSKLLRTAEDYTAWCPCLSPD